MEGININKVPRLRNPYLIVAWPGMGEVAFKAAKYLVEHLKCVEFAQIPSEEFFYLTGSNVDSGILSVPNLPAGKFYYWKNNQGKTENKVQGNDLIIFISEAQPDLAKAEDYCSRIIRLAVRCKVKTVIAFAAMPQPVDHTQDCSVYFAATSPQLLANLKKYNINLFNEGQISGMNGLFIGLAKMQGIHGFCLLGQIPLYTIQIENPKASLAVLETLCKILQINIDLSTLAAQAQAIEEDINRFLDYLKIGSQTSGPIGEEDVEKIKKALGQLTHLPISVKERIEKLFSLARKDIAKAAELKDELDKWNVYKEYEDRFLDLFKKDKGKGN